MRTQFRRIALATAIAGLAAVPAACADDAQDAPAAAAADSKVVSLTTETFKDFIGEHELVLAEFYAPWCGHCKALAPEYELAAEQLAEKDIPVVKVDCTQEMDLCREQGVQGYPTLKVIRGETDKPYRGPRKAASLTSFMIRQSLPAVSPITTAEGLEEFKALDAITVVGYIAADDKASLDVFTKIAEELRDTYPFAVTAEAALVEAETDGAKLPAIALYKDFDEKKAVFTVAADAKFDNETILTFIRNAATPLVGEMSQNTYVNYMTAGIPLGFVFAETEEERTELADALRPVAKQFKGKINIATIDAKLFGMHADTLNLEQKFPAFAIQDIAGNKKYPFDQSKAITEKDIAAFIGDVVAGKVEPSIKSEPIPESQDGPVTILVAHNYQELVMDDEKDVLVEFYAPWCGHCKALSPKYDDLGKLYKDNGFGDKVTIAKIDATANDVPEDIAGFPTIKLYPAGAKSEPVDFQDQRDVETLANFVRDHGKHGVDAWAAGLKKQEEDAKEEKEAEKKEKAEEKEEKEAEKKEKAAEKEEKEAEKSEAKEGEETASAAEAAEKPTPTGSADSAEPTSMTPVSGEQKEEATEAPAHEEL